VTVGNPNITRVREVLGFLTSQKLHLLRPARRRQNRFRAVRPPARMHVAFNGGVQCRTQSIRHTINESYLRGLMGQRAYIWRVSAPIIGGMLLPCPITVAHVPDGTYFFTAISTYRRNEPAASFTALGRVPRERRGVS
jgi:hypothetical protein